MLHNVPAYTNEPLLSLSSYPDSSIASFQITAVVLSESRMWSELDEIRYVLANRQLGKTTGKQVDKRANIQRYII